MSRSASESSLSWPVASAGVSACAAAGPAPDGKPDRAPFAATDKGRAWFLGQTSPRQVLEDVARAVERRHDQLNEWVAAARSVQAELAALKSLVAGVLPRLADPPA